MIAISVLGAGLISGCGMVATDARPCANIEVVFADDSGPAGYLGPVGEAFATALRRRIPDGRTLGVQPVDYTADERWSGLSAGAVNVTDYLVSVTQTCPETDVVLGGFAQGAAVIGLAVSAAPPSGVEPAATRAASWPAITDRVAAVVLFSAPNADILNRADRPQLTLADQYRAKTVQLCATGDPICSNGQDPAAHDSYVDDVRIIEMGAAFAAARLGANGRMPGEDPAPQHLLAHGKPFPRGNGAPRASRVDAALTRGATTGTDRVYEIN